ncbi:RHS repeat-associated core domain-containing protein, partial [Lonsdalea quercina]|uniref:RHS repeat-associated core domain-containing protein n=1 Tax=Lonsdalea quercina TaxID=71657 RepID=UPI00397512E5
QGQIYDAETGLYYNRHRYYDADSGQYISPDPIGLLGGNRPQAYVHNPLEFCDPLGLAKAGCPDKALKEIMQKMDQPGKEVSVTVGSKEEAEDVLRGYISSDKASANGGFRNTTDQKLPSGKKSDSGSDWLPGGRGAYEKQGTYHYDLADANAKAGDHALLGDHLQVHTYEGKIIRIFY